jgi:hypothetical protein
MVKSHDNTTAFKEQNVVMKYKIVTKANTVFNKISSLRFERDSHYKKKRFCYAAYNSHKFNGFINCTF